jgi:hypothetical protein
MEENSFHSFPLSAIFSKTLIIWFQFQGSGPLPPPRSLSRQWNEFQPEFVPPKAGLDSGSWTGMTQRFPKKQESNGNIIQ